MTAAATQARATRIPRKALYRTAGIASLIVGVLGLMVPFFPGIPFLILSAYCFSQADQ
jgi:uncharacterized membrane protein YbaN (DUF454 family)